MFNKNFELRESFFEEATYTEIKKAIKRHSGATFSVSAHQDYIYNDQINEGILKAIPLVGALGVKVLIISGTAKRGKTVDEAMTEWHRMLERTRRFVEFGEANGVTIAIEFEPNFIVGTTKDLHRLFEAIESPNLGANLDLGHVFLCDEDPMEAIKSLRGKIINGHIEDMAEGVHDHLLPGSGDMDLQAYVDALKAIGFEGSLGLDLYKYDYEAVSEEAIAYLKKLV